MKARSIVTLIVIVALVGAGFAFKPRLASLSREVEALIFPCRKPIPYTTGSIDSNFKISQDQLKQAAIAGEQIWEKGAGKNLFAFSSSGGIAINLSYDERQQLTQQAGEVEGNIEQGKKTYNTLVAKHNALVEQFQTRLKKYNENVAYWNSQGGAPKEDYEQLQEEARQLNAMVDEINSLVEQINSLARKLNLRVGEFNKITGEFNETLTVKPEAGLYSPLEASITIYQYDSLKELSLTVAHELGHVLGIGHVEQTDALMATQVTDKTHLTDPDLQALRQVCETPRPFTLSQKILLWLKLLYGRTSPSGT